MGKPKLMRTTTAQCRRDARDRKICEEYNALVADPEQSKTEVNKYLMTKYEIASISTLYTIRQRYEARNALKTERGGAQ
ncbi:MAG: hypothetical protein ACI4AK_05780 [Lepagella sp.]